MIKAFSLRLTSPYSGQSQIVETERARAVSVDGQQWEIQFTHSPSGQRLARGYLRVAKVRHENLADIARRAAPDYTDADERIVELAAFLAEAELPFPCVDRYECWLLDPQDGRPLALMFACANATQIPTFPDRCDWTALPAAIMPVASTEAEQATGEPPVNYRLERAVMRRAGPRPKARWFTRQPGDGDRFPPCLVREDWEDPEERAVCQRYIERQAARLLMLQRLPEADRRRLEQAAKPQAMEVERYCRLYPEVVDSEVINACRVEAVLRKANASAGPESRQAGDIPYI